VSHEQPLYDKRNEDGAVRKHLDVIRRVTGDAPSTCPWRAMYHPLVRDVMDALPMKRDGNLAVAIGADPAARLVKAIVHFEHARDATRNEDEKLAAKRREATKGAKR
jgi:hypothetical protein